MLERTYEELKPLPHLMIIPGKGLERTYEELKLEGKEDSETWTNV